MANKKPVGQTTGNHDGVCSCCGPMEERTRRGWAIALPLWSFYRLMHCEACGRFWHRIKDETSHWKEVCHDTASQLMSELHSSKVWRWTGHKPVPAPTDTTQEQEGDKIIQFPSAAA